MIIYKAKFPNGKIYIGKANNLEKRIKTHFSHIKHAKTKFSRACKKYGFENIKWEIVFESDNLEIINNKEKELIGLYNTIEYGYNISPGGDGGDTISNNPKKNKIIKSQLKTKGYMKYIPIDSNLKNQIIKDYLSSNFGIIDISKKYKISKQRISRVLKSNNIIINKNRSAEINTFIPSKELIENVINQYKNNKTIKDISEKENLTIMIVSRILHDSGIRESTRFRNGRRYDGRQPKRLVS
jgi:predicted GIY-YIG superfamily endonuclease